MQDITLMPGRLHGLVGPHSLRGWLAILLLGIGGRLISWAWQVAPAARRETPPADLEFQADTGGGRVYVDGRLWGTLAGVQRL